MAKKIISYKLNTDGTIPSYVEDGGYLPKNPSEGLNIVLMGVSKDGADISSAEAEFATQEDVIAYVSTYLSDSSYIDAVTNEKRIFSVADTVSELFAKLV